MTKSINWLTQSIFFLPFLPARFDKKILIMKSILFTLAALLLGSLQSFQEDNNLDAHIQVAILLDTSGSMSGLIEQAKSQLWSILNTLSNASKNDQSAVTQTGYFRVPQRIPESAEFSDESLFYLRSWPLS